VCKLGFAGHAVDHDQSRFDADNLRCKLCCFHELDILDENVVLKLSNRIRSGRILHMHFGVDCSSFSVLRIRSKTTSRSKANPWGNEIYAGEAAGNKMARNVIKLIKICIEVGTFWTVENPNSSRLWALPPFQKLSNLKLVESAVVDQCMFGLRDPISGGFYKTDALFGHTAGARCF
jgi:hypothetical protein